MAVAAAAAAGAFALAARDDGEPRPPARIPTTSAPESLDGPGEGEVVLAAPPGAVPAWLTREFERTTGCAVDVQTIAPDELAARVALDRGATIDLALVRSSDSLRLVEGGAVAALDGDLLEHRDDLLEPLREPAATTVDGRSYGLAYDWALDVLVSAPTIPTPSSLEVLLDPTYTGQVAMPDDVLTLATAALLNGVTDPYALTESELQGASSVLQAQTGLLDGRYADADGLARLLRGGALVALASSATAATLAGEGLSVTTTLPREGTTGWFESWQLTSRARHPVCAYRWLNLATAPETQAAIARDGLGPASGEACDLPGPGRCERLGLATPEVIGRVSFARTPIKPTPFGEWRRAWAVCCEP